MKRTRVVNLAAVATFCLLLVPALGWAEPEESKRMAQAKDLIADEQWSRAVDVLKAAAADPKEPMRDEALFWLAHSQNQLRDTVAALETIRRLERDFHRSRWVKPAQSLRIDIAQRLRRTDVLWYTAAPPAPPVAPVPATPPGGTTPAVAPAPPAPPSLPVARGAAPAPRRVPMPPPPPAWLPEVYLPDTDLRIHALGILIREDADRAVPLLRDIALNSENVSEARRALFVLAQSGTPQARTTVVDVARTAAEPVRIAAVRELGRLGGTGIQNELLRVYSTSNERLKLEVVSSLGARAATDALMQIARTEADMRLRERAIVTLGDAGGRAELQELYARASSAMKRPIITALFNARAEDALISIAERERDAALRQELRTRLRLLGTPKAKAYLESTGRPR